MGGARSSAWRDPLEGSDLPTEARVVREAVQNSVDATEPSQETHVFVWDKSLAGSELTAFGEAIGIASLDAPGNRLGELGLKPDNALERIKSGDGEIRVTLIEDRNTSGLGFDVERDKDRFKELCLYLGQGSPTVDEARGGSYGFGKTVYQASSNCRTFIVYSVFRPHEHAPNRNAILFGCSTFDEHQVGSDSISYTGRAWFGIPSSQDGHDVCLPIENEAAHDLATKLGFIQRDDDQFGTSIMIVGSQIDMGKVRAAFEDYWWPRIVSAQLSVELWEGDDDIKNPPEPLTKPHLQPFIRCFRLIEHGDSSKAGESKFKFNSSFGKGRGTIALKEIPPDVDEDYDPRHDSAFKNSVALIRSRPRMVVEYMNPGGRARGNFVGVFLSHPDAEKALHLSEPPAHNAWNPNADRLKEAGEELQNLVAGIIRTIKRRARRFQVEINPLDPPKRIAGSRRLERILSRIMAATNRTARTPPMRSEDPFQLRISERRVNNGPSSSVIAEVSVRLKDDSRVQECAVAAKMRTIVVQDDDRRKLASEQLEWETLQVNGDPRQLDANGELVFEIRKDSIVALRGQTEPFGRPFYAEFDITVRTIDQIDAGEAAGAPRAVAITS